MNWEGKKVVVLGDSITAGAAASAEENVYHQHLKNMLNLGELIAYGEGGTRIARQMKASEEPNFDRDFNERADAMDTNADLAIVFGGTNDFGHGDAPLGKLGDTTVYTFYGACRCLFEKLADRYDNKLVVITPMHRFGEDNVLGEGNKAVPSVPLKEYVEAVVKTAEAMHLNVLNFWEDDELNVHIGDHQKYFAPDGLHPNDDGHRLIAEKLAEYLISLSPSDI